MLKNHTLLCLLLSFCTTEYRVSITMNVMRGRPIILHLLICLFYLLKHNKPNKSQNHTSTLFITCLLQKWNFAFTLRKNWSGQNRSSRTDSTGPVMLYSDTHKRHEHETVDNLGYCIHMNNAIAIYYMYSIIYIIVEVQIV